MKFPRLTLRILHCRTEAEAIQMREYLSARLQDCGLEMHPDKTRVVYCKDANRTGIAENIQFDFLGYTFRPRSVRRRSGVLFTGFGPAMSRIAATSIRQTIRRWRPSHWSDVPLEELSRWYSPAIRGWMNYYCRFQRSQFKVIADHLDDVLIRWAMRKYKRLRGHKTRAREWLAAKRRQQPLPFPYWSLALE